MAYREKLQPDQFYHVYNHAVGNEDLFKSHDNYEYFIEKTIRYILPVADMYSYCLMKNHFHFLLKIKSQSFLEEFFHRQISRIFKQKFLSHSPQQIPTGSDLTLFKEIIINHYVTKQFSDFFSCYAQSYNKMYDRKGSLFLESFERKLVDSNDYFRQLVLYIHCNPVTHGFVNRPEEWAYSSYPAILFNAPTFVKRLELISLFDSFNNFVFNHNELVEPIHR